MAETLLFADDTSIFYSHSDPKHLIFVLNTELTEIMGMPPPLENF
jgi:hypothetical protein